MSNETLPPKLESLPIIIENLEIQQHSLYHQNKPSCSFTDFLEISSTAALLVPPLIKYQTIHFNFEENPFYFYTKRIQIKPAKDRNLINTSLEIKIISISIYHLIWGIITWLMTVIVTNNIQRVML